MGNKKLAVGISMLMLSGMLIGVYVVYHKKNTSSPSLEDSDQKSASSKAVEAICKPTDYKETCQTTLSNAAGNITNPKDLIRIAFNVAIQQVGDALNNMTVLKDAEADPRTKIAYENCHQLLQDSEEDLRHTVHRFDTFDLENLDDYLADIKTWLSGALTFQGTCLDGFENTTGDASEKMKQLLKVSGELTRNGLAMVDEFSKSLTTLDINSFTGRKLLASDGMPAWVDAGKRRLLHASNITISFPTPAYNLTGTLTPNVVVAKDGSGDCKTITEALAKVPKKNKKPFVILIKAGVYNEYVMVTKKMSNVVLLGEGPNNTRITGNKNVVDGTPTFNSATFTVQANHFFARGIGFENSAGAAKHQAVAVRVTSDMAMFYQCNFDGYQDTLYAHAHRQFYRECQISGTIDFIFGDASAVFQNCTMIVRKPLENQACMVTAQGRDERRENTGLVLQHCNIIPSPELKASIEPVMVYLGRPWKLFSRTIILNSNIDGIVAPQGWAPWAGSFGLETSFYAELGNTGAGASTSKRVTWGGIKKINALEASDFCASNFIRGNLWVKPTGLPYDSNI